MYNKFYFACIQASWVWAAWKRDSSEALSGGWLLVTSRTRQWSPWKFNQSWKGRLTIFIFPPSCATCGTFCTCMWLQARHQMWLERDFMSGEKCRGGDFLLLVVVSRQMLQWWAGLLFQRGEGSHLCRTFQVNPVTIWNLSKVKLKVLVELEQMTLMHNQGKRWSECDCPARSWQVHWH